MYKKILQTEKPITDKNLWCVSYNIICSNNISKNRCVSTFPGELSKNSEIIYKPSEEGIIVLGYIDVNSDNITTSQYYDSFRKASLIQNGIGLTDDLMKFENLHICRWVFDHQLQNKAILTKIFDVLFFRLFENNGIVWYDSTRNDEIIYYPIYKEKGELGYTEAVSHFASKFMSE